MRIPSSRIASAWCGAPILAAGLVWVLGVGISPALGQTLRPGDERPPLPGFPDPREESATLELPPLLSTEPRSGSSLAQGLSVPVRGYRILGSSVFSEAELARVTAPYSGRRIRSEELLEVRDALTRLYIEHGYISSGAVISDQDVEDGIVEIHIVEGQLAAVEVEGVVRFRPRYFERRLELARGRPVNIHDLERRLQRIQRHPGVQRVHAELRPGERRGDSFLAVRIEEDRPHGLAFEGGNDQSPSIGSSGGRLLLETHSLTGNGDHLSGSVRRTAGLEEWDVRYALPLNAHDTILDLHFRRSRSEVVERPFDDLDIESESTTWGVGLRHPLLRRGGSELWVGAVGELRRSETSLLGERFSFSPGADEGKSRLTVLRLFQEWTSRGRDRVLAVRSTFSVGLDLFSASEGEVAQPGFRVPDGTFLAWLGQFQWAQRLPARYRGAELILRTDVQLTNAPLLSLEQYAVGGRDTVRGYPENELVRDNGLVSSLELRIPLLRDALGEELIQIAPFADFGHAWNDQRSRSPRTIASLGLGLRGRVGERLSVAVYWGGRLRRVERRGSGLQRSGFHLEASIEAF